MFFSGKPDSDKEPASMGQRILSFCFAVFVSVVLLSLALQLLAQIWGWLLLIAILAAAVFAGFWFYRKRRDGW